MTEEKKKDAAEIETPIRAATGKARETLSHRDKFDFVKVEYLKRDYTYDGVVYGPGSNIEIPEGLAGILGLTGKRTSQRLTRREEHDAGLDKPEKAKDGAPVAVIPLSDPTKEGPSQDELDAANDAQGTTNEQIAERQAAAAGDAPPRARSASAPKK